MNRVFAQGFDDAESYGCAPPDSVYAEDWLINPNHIALVAEAGGEPVGALAAYVLPKFEQARSEIYIYDLAVLERARRQGVATALIDALRAIARAVARGPSSCRPTSCPRTNPPARSIASSPARRLPRYTST